MVDPAKALLIAGAIAIVIALLFWPERGLFWRALRALRAGERVLIEDALKHLYDFQYHGQLCT